MACTTALNTRLSSIDSFNSWKDTTSTSLGLFSAGSLTDQTAYTTLEADIYATLACIHEKTAALHTSTNDIQQAQTSILATEQSIKDAEEQIKIAKDRVAYTRDPDSHTSFYESWFPMDRPMKPISIPIFIGLITFFGVIIVLLLLSYFGINVSATFPLPQPSYGSPSMVSLLMAQITPVSVVAIATLIGVVIYFRRRN